MGYGNEEPSRGSDGQDGGQRPGEETFSHRTEGDSAQGRGGSVGKEDGQEGFVYFIETEDGKYVKIGYSADVSRRFTQIGLLLPNVRLIGYMPGTFKTETWIHGKFAPDRVSGEWFQSTTVLRTFIEAIGLIEPQPEPDPEPEPQQEPEPEPDPAPVATLMPNKTLSLEIREYAAAIGRRGGQARVPKGLAMADPAKRSAIAKKGAATRWGKVKG